MASVVTAEYAEGKDEISRRELMIYGDSCKEYGDNRCRRFYGGNRGICYPAEHQELYEKISKSGCIISEYPPGTKPRQYMFPQRNRLIAALSDDLYVVDTGKKSGTETTIAACIAYGGGRKVHQEFLSPIY